VNLKVFREYDIRGLVGTDLDDDFYHRLGLALGTYHAGLGDLAIVVGRDVRPSSPAYAAALRRGLVETGRRVLDLGLVTTPMTVFGLNFLGADGSVAVTASHNPSEYNGAKVRRRNPVFGAELQEVRRILEHGGFAKGRGSVERFDILPPYVNATLGRIRPDRALKVVVDAGNGSGALVGPDLLDRIGFTVVPLHCEVDGTFPNHHPDPTVPENLVDLRRKVVESGADCGVAFDGDGDRVVVVDEKGAIHWADRLLMLLALRLLPSKPGGVVVHDVKCSQGVWDVVERAGGKPVMVKTGYPYVLEGMRDPAAVLGGELSGHMYFGGDPLFNFDDGIHAACRILDVFSRDERPVSVQMADLPASVGTPEIRAEVPEDRKFDVTDRLVKAFREDKDVMRLVDIDGARATYPEGWGLVRASNTQPSLVLVFEARDDKGLEKLKSRFADKLSRFPEVKFHL
jgi:phosphomannomutase/phosphoglucomutase